MFNCLYDTWLQAPDHIKLPLPLAYHGMEVINIFTIGGYSDKALEGLGAGYRGEKKVWLDFTLACPPQTISSPSTWPAFGSGGRRFPSCCPSAAMWPQSTSSPGVAEPWDWPYQKWTLLYWSQKLVALGGHDGNSKLRSAEIYDQSSDSLLFRLDMNDLIM